MEKNIELAHRLREVFLNGHWIANTNYKEQLQPVGWEQATRKIAGLNSMAALTYHINYYLAGLLKVMEGGPLDIRDKYSFDVPEIRSEKDWLKLTGEFLNHAERFAGLVEEMPDEKLDAPFIEAKYGSYRRNIEAIIEHSYYHLGQISLLRKLTTT